MELDITDRSLAAYKALASPVRLKIIRDLSERKMSISELANNLGLSSTITAMHLDKLAKAGLIQFEKSGHNKMAKLVVDRINVTFPTEIYPSFDVYETQMPVGYFTNYSVSPSCGMAGPTDYIGKVDDASYFMDPGRIKAGMIWWNDGFVEYQFPNHLSDKDTLQMIDLSAELGSEFPFSNNVWPSDITFYINGVKIGTWTSPGDFSDIRGKFTPLWVPDNVNQYGLLKTIRITDHGSYLDGQPFTKTSIQDIDTHRHSFSVRFAIRKNAKHKGGCTIFGKGFGNYNQDIDLKLFHS
ncbi:ArsR/SmtB family transcription factor [Lentilactobacillus raoultii]|uniref:ArsR/SmtB family transcription factor n=1 Tax=Lentilactobacillus raoultii TaxID=1987503 RepID=A0ABW3PET5_9LACO|nr:ArsR family transcriptional regulator [Lentilactobacillus raoultii]